MDLVTQALASHDTTMASTALYLTLLMRHHQESLTDLLSLMASSLPATNSNILDHIR